MQQKASTDLAEIEMGFFFFYSLESLLEPRYPRIGGERQIGCDCIVVRTETLQTSICPLQRQLVNPF